MSEHTNNIEDPCLTQNEINNYLLKQSDKASLRRVEQHLVDCPLCADAMDGYAQNFSNQHNIPPKELTQTNIKSLNMNRIAAAILLFLIPLSTYLYLNATAEERLYHKYFQSLTSESFASARSANTNKAIDPEFEKALSFYEQQNFQGSIRHLENYIESHPQDASASFYLGVASLEEGQIAKAVQHLRIARINDEKMYEDATWYLILAVLKQGDKTEASLLIDELLKIKDSFYTEKANRLKDGLK